MGLTLKCPTGEAIVIGEAKYGRIPGASICSSLPEGALDENPQLFVPEYDDFAEGTSTLTTMSEAQRRPTRIAGQTRPPTWVDPAAGSRSACCRCRTSTLKTPF